MSNDAKNTKQWSKKQRAFMLFLALPKSERPHKTQRDFADSIDTNEVTLSNWKRLPNFADEVAQLSRDLVVDDVPDVLAAIRDHAKAGSIQHINLFLAMAGLSNDVANANSQRVVTEKELSDDELLRIATTSRD